MSLPWIVRLRRTNLSTFPLKIIKNMKKIDENHNQMPQKNFGAFGAEVLNKGGDKLFRGDKIFGIPLILVNTLSCGLQVTEIRDLVPGNPCIFPWCEFFDRITSLIFFRHSMLTFRRFRPRQSIPGTILRRYRWCTFLSEFLCAQSYIALKLMTKIWIENSQCNRTFIKGFPL